MSASSLKALDLEGHAIIFSNQEFLTKQITSKLDQSFSYAVTVKQNIEDLIQLMTESKVKTDLLIFDLDATTLDHFQRIYKLINYYELPCLVVSEDPGVLHQLSYDADNSFMTFLPKSIVSSMFRETIGLLLEKTTPQLKLNKRIKDFSLLKKPPGLYLLATLFLLEPLFKTVYLKVSTGFAWDTIFRTIFSIEGVWANFEYWGIFPLAGYALYSVRSWSFFAFAGLQVYSLFAYFTYEKFTWPFVAETPHLSNTILLLFNSLLIGYFLTPEHRRPFWNKAQRLWRDSSRYATKINTSITGDSQNFESTITNISNSGAYFTSDKKINVGDKINLGFQLGGRDVKVQAKVRRAQETAHSKYQGYGVEFFKLSSDEKEYINDYISGLVHRIQ